MARSCSIEYEIDPRCIEMDAPTFRQFVHDECAPVMFEALAKAKTQFTLVDAVLDQSMRSGEAGMSCSGDSHGNVSCEGHVSIRW